MDAIAPAPVDPHTLEQNRTRIGLRVIAQSKKVAYAEGMAHVEGKTEKPYGIDPTAIYASGPMAGKVLLLGRVPLDAIAPNTDGARYDGTVDLERAQDYAQRGTEPPPIILKQSRRGHILHVLDGGHRISAARMQGRNDIYALTELFLTPRLEQELAQRNLPPHSARQAALLAWAKDSTVTDSVGVPLLLYHGTPARAAINSFVAGGMGEDGYANGDLYGVATYLTTCPHEASQYAGAEGCVYPVYVKGNMLHLRQDAGAALPHAHSALLTGFAKDFATTADKSRFPSCRKHKDFSQSQTEDAKAFFMSQRAIWDEKAGGMVRSLPEVVRSEHRGHRIAYTDFDAPILVSTSEDARQLFIAVGWDSIQATGLDGVIVERDNGNTWVACHNTLTSIKSALSAKFETGNPYLCDRSDTTLLREIGDFCEEAQDRRPKGYRPQHLHADRPGAVLTP